MNTNKNTAGDKLRADIKALATFQRAQAIADRVALMRSERASGLGEKAGVGPWRNVWHNAMIAYRDGMPWQEVDYTSLRKAIRVDAMPAPAALVDILWHRYVASVREGK